MTKELCRKGIGAITTRCGRSVGTWSEENEVGCMSLNGRQRENVLALVPTLSDWSTKESETGVLNSTHAPSIRWYNDHLLSVDDRLSNYIG